MYLLENSQTTFVLPYNYDIRNFAERIMNILTIVKSSIHTVYDLSAILKFS